MDKKAFGRAAWETGKAVLATTAFSLFSLAIAAAFIRSFPPSRTVLVIVNWALKAAGVFAFSLLFVRRERALFKGMAAGLLSALVTMLLFAAIGGGFHLDALFLVELLLCALCGGGGALLGAKLRKE